MPLHGGADESVEERMTGPGGAFEFGVELHADEPGVLALGQFDDFGEVLALGEGGDD